MTRLKRMAMVDAWLKADQSMMSFSKENGIQLCDLLDWVMQYGQPTAALIWVPVRILDGLMDNYINGPEYTGYYPRSDATSPRVAGCPWIPVVIQERT